MADKALSEMTKKELETFAQERFGVDLDRRKTHAALVEEVEALAAVQEADRAGEVDLPAPDPDADPGSEPTGAAEAPAPKAKNNGAYKGDLTLGQREAVVQTVGIVCRRAGNTDKPSAARVGHKVGAHLSAPLAQTDLDWAYAEAKRRSSGTFRKAPGGK